MTTPENPTNTGNTPGETPDLTPLAQDLINREAPDAELHALLRELEETADELRSELEARLGNRDKLEGEQARAHRKINPNVTPEQEEELKHFPEYWANSKGSWSNLFKLLRELRNEMREGKGNA
ncbi:hypothetical protein [Nocardia cyriacigeorgica]|uniref:hypothetical protein n=1 Tax=Nocardia cyriacigeorgica TaxID=135487 RepID=UPI0018960A96|nr:hypothetical protein [Nocardia cyriacigeorgica]MBF6476908.1 hypothetical protein [Nocardia cyriacigeorgica]